VLDLERALQSIDPSVTAHYWRFDQPTPTLFTLDFMDQSDPFDSVMFNPGHALSFVLAGTRSDSWCLVERFRFWCPLPLGRDAVRAP